MSNTRNNITTLWEGTQKRFVLFMDIMGFKDRVSRTEHVRLEKQLKNFSSKWRNKTDPLFSNDHLRISQFSDSIIAATNDDSTQSLTLITRAAVNIMQAALEVGFPIKGGIACGKCSFIADEQIQFGQAIVDAYQMQESLWLYGVIAHHTMEASIKRMTSSDKINGIYKYGKIQLKEGLISHYYLDWTMIDKLNRKQSIASQAQTWLSKIEETVSGSPRRYIDNTKELLLKNNDASNN